MGLQALVLTRDVEALRVLRRVLEQLDINPETAATVERTEELLSKRRFDAVVVDCDDLAGAAEMLRCLRHSPSNKRSLAFAVVNGKTSVREAFDLGANFVLDKPLTADRALRSFRAAHGLMMRERRRYFRNPLTGLVQLTLSGGSELRGRLINLSEGGMSVTVPERLVPNTPVRVRFTLPQSTQQIEAKGEVSWTGSDKAGVRFLHMEQKMQRELEQWVAKQTDLNLARSPVFINATVRVR